MTNSISFNDAQKILLEKVQGKPWFCGLGVNEDTLKLYIYVEKK